jgi:hypothetical protein
MYSNYKGQCIGRLLHFMYEYSVHNYDLAIFDGKTKTVLLHGRLLAEYSWDLNEKGEETDYPTFKFHGPNREWFEKIQGLKKARVIAQCKLYDKMFNREAWKKADDIPKPLWAPGELRQQIEQSMGEEQGEANGQTN